jgi:hypothetical protein
LDKKELLKGRKYFFEVDPTELESFEEFAEYLESMLSEPCTVWEKDGELILFEIKALVANIRGLRIEIYPKEHAPPHFHVLSANIDASFRIDNCELLNGTISSSDHKKILYWHKYSKQLLIEKWNSMRPTNCPVGFYTEEQ